MLDIFSLLLSLFVIYAFEEKLRRRLMILHENGARLFTRFLLTFLRVSVVCLFLLVMTRTIVMIAILLYCNSKSIVDLSVSILLY